MSTNILFQDSGLQGCDTALVVGQFQMFQGTVMPSFIFKHEADKDES